MNPTAPGNDQSDNTNNQDINASTSFQVGSSLDNTVSQNKTPSVSPVNSASENQDQTQSNTEIPTQSDNTSAVEGIPKESGQTPPLEANSSQPTNAMSNEPQIVTTQVQTPQEVITDNSGKKSRKPILFLLLLLFFLLILTGLGGLTYAVAYEKIKLDKYPDVQKRVSNFVMELPFMPKAPKFLIARSAIAHQEVTKQSFDISMAVDSADLTSSLGLSNLDVQAKGAFDYSDPRNVFGNLEISVTKDFNFEIKKKDKMLYFKLNKLPSFLFAFLGVGTNHLEPILGKWVSYDTTPLDTEARKSISEDREVDPLSEEFLDENFQKFIDDEVLSKLVLSSDTEEGHSVYKITLDADSELIDHIGKKIEELSSKSANYTYPQSTTSGPEKLSEFVKKLKMEMYIDKKSYYTRKVIVSVDLEYDSIDGITTFSLGSLINPSSKKQSAKVVMAAKFDHIGEDVVVTEPENPMTFEEFTNLLSSTFNEIYGSYSKSSFNMANDARRKADLATLRSALEMYNMDCGKYPSNLSDMTHSAGAENCQYQSTISGSYISEIPTDPSGSDYYYRTSIDGKTYDLCAKLENPETYLNTCPDKSFNYHLTQP